MKTLESISGNFNGVRVSLYGMPVQTANNGKTTFVDPDFGPFVIGQIFDRQMVFATKKRWLHAQQLCRQCCAPLDTSHSTLNSFDLDLTFKTFPRFRLLIELPAVKCSSCSAPNAILTRALTSDIPDALLDAFQASSISRS